MIEQRVTLRYGAQQIPAIVQAVQGDTGRDVIFELADYEIPAGATANYYIDKPDGNAVYNSAEVISSTEILAHLTEQALAEPGRNNGQVRILSDGEVITSFDFVLEVEAFRGILRLQSETEVNIFDEALQTAAEDAIQEILDQTPVVTGMQNSIAPTYSASSTYAVGDYVMYNAQLYKCNTAITTAEAWTAAHWTQVPIASDVSDLKSALDNEKSIPLGIESLINRTITTSGYGNGFMYYVRKVKGKRVNDLNGKLIFGDDENSVCYFFRAKPSTGYYFSFARYLLLLAEDMETTIGNLRQKISGVNTTEDTAYIVLSVNPETYPEETFYYTEVVNSRNELAELTIDSLTLTQLQESYLTTNIYQDEWEIGDISTATGENIAGSNNTLRTKAYFKVFPQILYKVKIPEIAKNTTIGYLYQYNKIKDYYGSVNIITIKNDTTFAVINGCEYARIVLAASYGTTFNNNVFIYQQGGLVKNITTVADKLLFENTRFIVVDITGNGDFTSLRQAVMHSNDGDIIFVRKGVYDNQEVEAWDKNITIIGESPYNTIIQNSTDDYHTPPLEMSVGNLYNITFHAIANAESTRKAYALHIDNDNQENGTFYAENCIFISDDGPAAVGAGSRRNHRQVYKHCTFINSTNEPAFFGNEATNQQTAGIVNNQYYEFYDCTFQTPNAHKNVVIMRGMKAEGNTVWCIFKDCSFMDDGTTEHPIFRMDYTSAQYMGEGTTMGDMGLINWNLDPISSGNTIPELNRCKQGSMLIIQP